MTFDAGPAERDESPDALRAALREAQQRLAYYEKFGATLQEQIDAVVARAAAASREADAAHAEIQGEVARLRDEGQHLRDEGETIPIAEDSLDAVCALGAAGIVVQPDARFERLR